MQESLSSPMYPDVIIQEGALFIADAHACEERSFFLNFLHHVKQNPPPQLFLMGDMFDLLVGGITHGVQKYQRYIELINEISHTCEVFYFEGNHDFHLTELFLHVKVIPIEAQPLTCKLPSGKICLLSHGDKYGGTVHSFYTKLIRNENILRVLGFVDSITKGAISKKIENNQKSKHLCKKILHFRQIIEAKLEAYPLENIDMVAEGHYHQNQVFTCKQVEYINFSSFACNQSYFSVQSSHEREFAQMQLRGCNG